MLQPTFKISFEFIQEWWSSSYDVYVDVYSQYGIESHSRYFVGHLTYLGLYIHLQYKNIVTKELISLMLGDDYISMLQKNCKIVQEN